MKRYLGIIIGCAISLAVFILMGAMWEGIIIIGIVSVVFLLHGFLTKDIYPLPTRKETINDIDQGLKDLIHIYGHDFTSKEELKESWQRIRKNGGTLAHIADLRTKVRKLL